MTWTKLGDEFSDEAADMGLSDAAYRTHVEAIQWLYRVERDDCRIPANLVRRFAGSADFDHAIKELVAGGLWVDRGDHYVLKHHATVVRQSLKAQRDKRLRDRKAAQTYRAKPRDVSADVSAESAAESAATQTDRQHLRRASKRFRIGLSMPTTGRRHDHLHPTRGRPFRGAGCGGDAPA